MTSLLAAAFIKASGRKKEDVGIPVNIRSNGDRCMSNQVTGVNVPIKVMETDSLTEIAKKFQRKLDKKIKNPVSRYLVLRFLVLLSPSLIDAVLLSTYGRYENAVSRQLAGILGYQGRTKRSIGITNLTRLDIPSEYGRYSLKSCIFLPPAVTYSKRILGIATMEDGMTITFHGMSDENYVLEKQWFQQAMAIIHSALL